MSEIEILKAHIAQLEQKIIQLERVVESLKNANVVNDRQRLEDRAHINELEQKISRLEGILNLIDDIKLANELQRFIERKERISNLTDLVNAASNVKVDLTNHKSIIDDARKEQAEADARVDTATQAFAKNPSQQSNPDDQTSSIADFKFSYLDEGIRIDKYIGNAQRIVIPNEIDERPVIRIRSLAFKNVSATKIIIPETVNYIEGSAFESDYRLHILFRGSDVRLSLSCCDSPTKFYFVDDKILDELHRIARVNKNVKISYIMEDFDNA